MQFIAQRYFSHLFILYSIYKYFELAFSNFSLFKKKLFKFV